MWHEVWPQTDAHAWWGLIHRQDINFQLAMELCANFTDRERRHHVSFESCTAPTAPATPAGSGAYVAWSLRLRESQAMHVHVWDVTSV